MKLTPDTTVQDILLDKIKWAAFHALQDAVTQIENAGSINGMNCHHNETMVFLDALSGGDSDKKKEIIAGLLPQWFFEIKKILDAATPK